MFSTFLLASLATSAVGLASLPPQETAKTETPAIKAIDKYLLIIVLCFFFKSLTNINNPNLFQTNSPNNHVLFMLTLVYSLVIRTKH